MRKFRILPRKQQEQLLEALALKKSNGGQRRGFCLLCFFLLASSVCFYPCASRNSLRTRIETHGCQNQGNVDSMLSFGERQGA